jgi:hypothetical protein
MQVHGPSVVLKQPRQEIRATLIDRKFVRLSVGPVDIHVQTAEEADILIAAAAEAKRLLDPPVITGSERTRQQQNPDGGVLFNLGHEGARTAVTA